MAIKHHVIKPVRHAGVASQDHIYISGGVIVEGAPVVFSSGKVVEATDDDAGAAGPFVGFALNAAAGANEDVLVALALPGRRFVGSLTDIAASVASDGGTKAIALADISATPVELHKDNTTLKWVLGAGGGANAAAVILGLVDKVGSTTNDATTFGASGSPTGVTPATTTPPGRTFQQDPTGSNTGKALVEFVIEVADTIYG